MDEFIADFYDAENQRHEILTRDLPFFMKLPPKGENGIAQMLNADEITEFKIVWQGDAVQITSPWNYTSVIDAKLEPDGSLTGTWTRDTPLWGEVVRELVAKPISKPDPTLRFENTGTPPSTSVAGIWEFDFAEHEEGKGVLEQTPDVEAIVIPVGGGGLIAGVGTAVKAKRPGVQVVRREPERAACLAAARAQDAPLPSGIPPTRSDR